jgi:hypothetical protein
MRKELKPIVGALVIGLIGAAEAVQHCYNETSYVCLAQGAHYADFVFSCGTEPAVATTDWYAWTLITDNGSPGHTGLTHNNYCQGNVTYYNCFTMQPETNGPWQTGSAFDRPDYSSPGCNL